MLPRRVRPASHASNDDRGWYQGNKDALSKELDHNLDLVPASIGNKQLVFPDARASFDNKELPIPRARVIIAPHAGYKYSGECAAWAYKCLDLTDIKRVFILGPSHTYYLRGCAVTRCHTYETPLGNLAVDTATVQDIKRAGRFDDVPFSSDVREHSLEMHLPYIYKRITQTFSSPDQYPTIVPILVGDNDRAKEREAGKVLAPYLKDPHAAFVISSDFCHWGRTFDYTVYSPTSDPNDLERLSPNAPSPTMPMPMIHETIEMVDKLAMEAVETGRHDNFVDSLRLTKNTVCGRHPIGVMMAALEELAKEGGDEEKGRFIFVQYQRSLLVEEVSDSSVSYASAYAVI